MFVKKKRKRKFLKKNRCKKNFFNIGWPSNGTDNF